MIVLDQMIADGAWSDRCNVPRGTTNILDLYREAPLQTAEQATATLRSILGAFGEPDHAPFIGDVKTKTIAAVLDYYRHVGDAAFAQTMQQFLSCVRTLALPQSPASSSSP